VRLYKTVKDATSAAAAAVRISGGESGGEAKSTVVNSASSARVESGGRLSAAPSAVGIEQHTSGGSVFGFSRPADAIAGAAASAKI